MSDYYWIEKAREDLMAEIRRQGDTQDRNAKQLLTAFNKMTQAIETLTGEVRAIREELNPKQLDKSKLPTPGQGG